MAGKCITFNIIITRLVSWATASLLHMLNMLQDCVVSDLQLLVERYGHKKRRLSVLRKDPPRATGCGHPIQCHSI